MKYHIIMKKDDFFKINKRIIATNVTIVLDDSEFDCDYKSFNIIKQSGYNYKYSGAIKDKIIQLITKYRYLIIGLLFMLSIIYINTYRFDNILFNTDTPINSKIAEDLKLKAKKLFCFNFISINYADYSNSLRYKYPEYPCIEVILKGNNICVSIYSYDSNIEPINTIGGNIISKYEGIVDNYYVYEGKAKITKNMLVKKGQILIEGVSEENNTQASGIILGYTYEKIKLEILKEEHEEKLTGSCDEFYKINIFNGSFDISKNSNYQLYEDENYEIFNLFSFFSIRKYNRCEKYDIIKKNSIDDAIKKAENKINEDFNGNKVSNDEKIEALRLYSSDETSTSYILTFIAKKYISFGEFTII